MLLPTFSPVCLRACLLRSYRRAKVLSHPVQAYIFGFEASSVLPCVLDLELCGPRARPSATLSAASLALKERHLDEPVLWLRASSVAVWER